MAELVIEQAGLEIYLSCDPVKDLKDIDDFE